MIFLIVVLFIIFPILTFPLIILGIVKDKKNRLFYLFLVAFDIALVTLHFDPSNYGLDLNVYYGTMDLMKKMSWDTFIQVYSTQKEFLTNFLFYVFASINNYGFWNFIVAFVSYSLLFYMITDYAKIKEISDRNYFLVLLLLIILYNNFFIMTGIRNSLAMILFLFVLYLEFIKENKKIFYKVLYIIPCLIHMSMVLAIILRLLLVIYKGRKRKYIILGLIIYAFFPSVVLQIANELNGMSIFSDLYIKTTNYVAGQNQTIFENLMYIIKTLIFINLFIIFEKLYKNDNTRIKNATELICLFVFFSFNYTIIMYRWFDACTILLCLSFINKIDLYKRIKGIYKILLGLSIIFCIYQQIDSFSKTNFMEVLQETSKNTLIEQFEKEE